MRSASSEQGDYISEGQARRSLVRNPEVVRFKSHPRNHEKLFCLFDKRVFSMISVPVGDTLYTIKNIN